MYVNGKGKKVKSWIHLGRVDPPPPILESVDDKMLCARFLIRMRSTSQFLDRRYFPYNEECLYSLPSFLPVDCRTAPLERELVIVDEEGCKRSSSERLRDCWSPPGGEGRR